MSGIHEQPMHDVKWFYMLEKGLLSCPLGGPLKDVCHSTAIYFLVVPAHKIIHILKTYLILVSYTPFKLNNIGFWAHPNLQQVASAQNGKIRPQICLLFLGLKIIPY